MSTGSDTSNEVELAATPATLLPRARRAAAETGMQSIDTFAMLERAPAQSSDLLAGDEPAVFGGRNPNSPGPDEAGNESREADASDVSSVGSNEMPTAVLALDEQLRGNELLETPRADIFRIMRSTPFLVSCLVVLLIIATVFVRASVRTETFVQCELKFINYEKLEDLAKQDLQLEINRMFRTYPLRAEAWEMLQKRSPGLQPGFLNSGLTFHRLDSLQWDSRGVLRVRVDSDDPINDITRFSSIVETFYKQAQGRNRLRDESRDKLQEMEDKHARLLKEDAELKLRIDQLLPDAQRYMDLKAALQSTERYLEMADESNPLRLVARQNLKHLVTQVAETRGLALERDEKTAARVGIQKDTADAVAEIARLRKYIETFAYPTEPDLKAVRIYDTRPFQKAVLRYTWIGLIALFGGIIAYIHWLDRQAESEQRELRRRRRRATVAKTQAA